MTTIAAIGVKKYRRPIDHVRGKRRRTYNPASHRLRELERIINARHGKALDTDDAGIYLVPVAQTLRRFHESKNGAASFDDVLDRLTVWAKMWTPKIADNMLRDAADEAMQNRKMDHADALAHRLRLTNAQREVLDLRTIGACDVSKAARARLAKERRRARNRARMAAWRLKKGMRPREQWLAQTLSRARPWDAEGISRRTWERRRRKGQPPAPDPVSQVCRPIGTTVRGHRPATRWHPRSIDGGIAVVAIPTTTIRLSSFELSS